MRLRKQYEDILTRFQIQAARKQLTLFCETGKKGAGVVLQRLRFMAKMDPSASTDEEKGSVSLRGAPVFVSMCDVAGC